MCVLVATQSTSHSDSNSSDCDCDGDGSSLANCKARRQSRKRMMRMMMRTMIEGPNKSLRMSTIKRVLLLPLLLVWVAKWKGWQLCCHCWW